MTFVIVPGGEALVMTYMQLPEVPFLVTLKVQEGFGTASATAEQAGPVPPGPESEAKKFVGLVCEQGTAPSHRLPVEVQLLGETGVKEGFPVDSP